MAALIQSTLKVNQIFQSFLKRRNDNRYKTSARLQIIESYNSYLNEIYFIHDNFSEKIKCFSASTTSIENLSR